ncbi:MAG: helix-turn-helix domain-containing protein [Candidatus Caldarchaeales archaeon]
MESGRTSGDWLVNQVAYKIAAEIVFSNEPGRTMRKWRLIFGLTQKDVASAMGISSPVLSDYEKGKRRSPGINFVSRFVRSLIDLDLQRGGKVVHKMFEGTMKLQHSVIDMVEFPEPVELMRVVEAVAGVPLTLPNEVSGHVYGYTVIDSLAAITELGPYDFVNLFGRNSMRAMVFTNVTSGRSPMVAIRVFPLKPKAVILHGPKRPDAVDELAKRLSEIERIPLILSTANSVESMIKSLRSLVK